MNRIQKWKKLCEILHLIVQEVTGDNKELIRRVLDRHKKDIPTVMNRMQILKRIRSEVWEYSNVGAANWDITFTSTPPREYGWRPLSYPCIARILGGNHSSWVKMAAKMKSVDLVAVA